MQEEIWNESVATRVWSEDKTTGSSSGLLKLRDGMHCFLEICVLPIW